MICCVYRIVNRYYYTRVADKCFIIRPGEEKVIDQKSTFCEFKSKDDNKVYYVVEKGEHCVECREMSNEVYQWLAAEIEKAKKSDIEAKK